jgi:uncharacterized membrane protein
VVLPPVPPLETPESGGLVLRKSLAISIAAVFAALYAIITIAETSLGGPLTYGVIQVRISDALLPLPLMFGLPSAIGLFIGTLVANAYYMLSPLDILFGSVANLIAGVLSARFSRGNVFLAAAYPVVVVTIIIGSYLPLFFVGVPLWLIYAGVGTGEIIACFVLGVPLLKILQRILGKGK